MGRKPTVNLTLPRGMRARPKAGGKIYYYLDTGAKPRKEIPLGSHYPAAVQKWAELTITSDRPPVSFKDVADMYVIDVMPTKAKRTRDDNAKELVKLLEFFNDPPAVFEEIEPLHIRQFMDWRVQSSRAAAAERNVERVAADKKPLDVPINLGHVRANREKALFSHIWNYARNKGITDKANPCAGITGYTETGRDQYTDDEIYTVVYENSSQSLKDTLDLSYQTGQRPADVLKMDETHIRDNLLGVGQNKTKAKLRLRLVDEIEPGVFARNELGQLIDRIILRKRANKITTMALIWGERTRQRVTASGLDSAFDRARAKAIKAHPELEDRIKDFQFRDLRAKAGTDKEDSHGMREAQRQLGHTTMRMTETYVRKGNVVTPTGRNPVRKTGSG